MVVAGHVGGNRSGGKGPGKYNLHLGGDYTRIPRMYKENISEDEIFADLDELVGRWAAERNPDERFGDFPSGPTLLNSY